MMVQSSSSNSLQQLGQQSFSSSRPVINAPYLSSSTSFAPPSHAGEGIGGVAQEQQQRRLSELLSPSSSQQQRQQQQQAQQPGMPPSHGSSFNLNPVSGNGSSVTTYGAPITSATTVGSRAGLKVCSLSGATCPNWGPPLFPPPSQSPDAACAQQQQQPRSLSSLYLKNPSSSNLPSNTASAAAAAAVVPFAPPPHAAQNICDDQTFYDLYKSVWASGFHGIHDGIERPAVLSLLPARVYWANKRCLDIGCGAGNLCRQMRKAQARSVVGLDCSTKMINVARLREAQAEAAHCGGTGGSAAASAASLLNSGASSSKGGVSGMLRKLFGAELTEDQMAEKLEKEKVSCRAARSDDFPALPLSMLAVSLTH